MPTGKTAASKSGAHEGRDIHVEDPQVRHCRRRVTDARRRNGHAAQRPQQPKYSANYGNDRAQIEDLMARYLFAIDYFDWDAYVATFAPDGELDFASGTSKGATRSARR